VELQISSSGSGSFSGSDEATPVQVNRTLTTDLIPVSTSDLKSFVYCPSTVEDVASSFQLVEDESYYYHGRIYLRAAATGDHSGSKMNLYLDQESTSGGILAQASQGSLLNAARLGLTFDGGDAVIFRLSDSSNASADQVRNTMVDGKLLGDHQVLRYGGQTVQAVDDPAVSLAQYTVSLDGDTVGLPDQPLASLTLNQIYTVDIYFYLEGCDPDCSGSISYDGADLHLAFYGILE
jgi:hypothetical protein